MASELDPGSFFFLIGPLRTGSSLMSRCIDDHPAALCLCESEINRTLFPVYCLEYHCERMSLHGLSLEATIELLDRKKQNDIGSFLRWHGEVRRKLADLYSKEFIEMSGDKSPDYFVSPELVRHLAASHPLIYTVRDPRAILGSIEREAEVPESTKRERWDNLIQNYVTWEPHLDSANVLCVRYEDLIGSPEATMRAVYAHLKLPYSSRYMEQFSRPCPQRFHWETNVDRVTGMRRDFDPDRATYWRAALGSEQLARVQSDAVIADFMDRFGYGD